MLIEADQVINGPLIIEPEVPPHQLDIRLLVFVRIADTHGLFNPIQQSLDV